MKKTILISLSLIAAFLGGYFQRPTVTREYRFNVDSAGYDIYRDDTVLVGRLNYGENYYLDSLILDDNQ